MKHRIFAGLLGTALLLPLAGCSWLTAVPGMERVVGQEGMFRDRQGEYLRAETIPRTRIPDGMDSYIIDDLLVVPDLAVDDTQSFLDAPRPRSIEGRSDRGVVIQRMENNAWIIVDVSPSQVWPRIRDYWRQAGIEIVQENPTAGLMDTGWFIRGGEALNRDKIRVIVENGFQDDSAEIRLLQQSALQATPVIDQFNWPAASMSADVEYEVLTALSVYLADVADLYQASSVSFLAGNISSTGKATLDSDGNGGEVLVLQAGFSRSWAAVGRAMTRAGVELLSQDSDQGLYQVRYTPGMGEASEEEPGFFRKLVTLNGLFSGEERAPSTELEVRLETRGSTIRVYVTPVESDSAAAEAAAALLRMIRNTIA
jgi:outer membrane protein assembly factor BamC